MKAPSTDDCVQIRYEVETEGGQEIFSPPFVIGVLADFSKQRTKDSPPLMHRHFVHVDRDNWGDVKAKFAPHLKDNEPLPTAWLALQRLVNCVATGLLLKIKVLDVNKSELQEDLCGPEGFTQAELFRRVYETEYGSPGGHPYGLLIVDFEFEPNEQDLKLLTALAALGEKSATEILVAPAPSFLGVQSFDDVTNEHLQNVKKSEQWQHFRSLPTAKFVAMAMPRFEVAKNQYANACWLVAETVGQAIAHNHWPAKIAGELNQHVLAEIRTEFPVSRAQQLKLEQQGLLSLCSPMDSANPSRFSLSTCSNDCLLNEMLCASLFRRAISIICRDRIGAFMSVEEMERCLRDWLQAYTTLSGSQSSADAQRPLRHSQLVMESIDGRQIALEMSIQLGFQFEELNTRKLTQRCCVPFMDWDSVE